MDDFSFLCTTQASQNFMAEGLGTLKVHTTHVLVDFLNFNVQSMFHDHGRC